MNRVYEGVHQGNFGHVTPGKGSDVGCERGDCGHITLDAREKGGHPGNCGCTEAEKQAACRENSKQFNLAWKGYKKVNFIVVVDLGKYFRKVN